MKKAILIIVTLALTIGGIMFWQLQSKEELIPLEEEKDVGDKDIEIFCPDYDGNQQECLSHSECKWDADKNNCDLAGGMEGEDADDGSDKDNPDGEEEDEFSEELEAIEIPDSLSNDICKRIPLSGYSSYGARYQCLAIINHDARFCEGIDEEKEKKMCLAFANKDSSYCQEVQDQDSKHVCYFVLAVSSENVNFCRDIDYLETAQENKEEKLNCYYNFISNLYQWDKSDEIKAEYCNEFPSDYEDRDTCFALKARNASLCGDNPNCLTHFERSLSFCDGRPEFSSCIKDRAKTNRDVSICEMLPRPDRDSCIGVYCTHIELDINICDKIEDIRKRQEVYIELAMNLANW
jgi:hypothetical protein